MDFKPYEKSLLMMGVLSVKGLPSLLCERLEKEFGKIAMTTSPIPFDFTDYYVSEMGEGIERFFLAFDTLVSPDCLAQVKRLTKEIEMEWAENGKRRINLDPGLISESNLILATTKNRGHRIPIGLSLYGEVTLIYHKKGWQSFEWTYSDYRSGLVQRVMTEFRGLYLEARRAAAKKQS